MEADIVAFRAKLEAKEHRTGFGDNVMRAELRAKEEAFLAPDTTDLAGLEGPNNTGQGVVIRLLPREKYQQILRLNGGGAYYSFTRLTHEYGQGSDLELQLGKLSVGFAGADYGIFADLGDIPLEVVTRETAGVSDLARYLPPGDERNARLERARFHQASANNLLARTDQVTATVGRTFALRSINYRRADVLVAFRVLRQAEDGSVILSWKLLQRYATPSLELSSPATAPAKVSK